MITFKRFRAQARRIILTAKKQSWEKYVSSLTRDTPLAEIWAKIRKISGKSFSNVLLTLLDSQGNTVKEVERIAEILAEQFQNASSSLNYSPAFQQLKLTRETRLDFSENNISEYNVPFTYNELDNALSNSGNSVPGPDSIPYEMIRKLPETVKKSLLDLYNTIWQNGTYIPG